MNTDQQVITELFFDAASLETLPAEQLNDFIAQHPHSAAARILLLKKIRHGDPDQFKAQLFKTSLYLSNPLMLDQHLRSQEITPGTSFFVEEPFVNPNDMQHPADAAIASESVTQEFDTGKEMADQTSPGAEETFFSSLNEAEINQGSVDAEELHREIDESSQEITDVEEESLLPATTKETNSADSTDTEPHDRDTAEIEMEDQKPAEDRLLTEMSVAQTDSTEPEIVDKPEQVPGEIEKLPLKEANSEFAFEAFHTVDYFASQGIRLRPSELGKDKLGQQLKSFTDWLRSMKRLPESSSDYAGDESAQQTISIIAAHSLEEKEVITEAMAQVWAKQGNRQKAIAIYEKLSLQNPSKTPYFAAKIDQLNSL